MARLIVVAGGSGAGKTFLLSQLLLGYREDIIPIKKYTTRSFRETEPPKEFLDLNLNSSMNIINKCKYVYQFCGNYYGINKDEIDTVIKENKNPIILVARYNTIIEIKRDYLDALVIYIHSGLSGEDLRKQLLKYNDFIDVEERMRRQRNEFNDYIQHCDNKGIFDYIFINYFDDTFIRQLEFVLEKELNTCMDTNYIFMIMSFHKKYDDVYEACKISGKSIGKKIKIERVSEQFGDYIITERIEQSIIKAGLIICDVSERSPNVYYELGYARAMKKTVIMIAKEGTELPFDIRQYRTIFYNNPLHLQKLLVKELEIYYY